MEHIPGICVLTLLQKVLLVTCTCEQTTDGVSYLWLWSEAAPVHGSVILPTSLLFCNALALVLRHSLKWLMQYGVSSEQC